MRVVHRFIIRASDCSAPVRAALLHRSDCTRSRTSIHSYAYTIEQHLPLTCGRSSTLPAMHSRSSTHSLSQAAGQSMCTYTIRRETIDTHSTNAAHTRSTAETRPIAIRAARTTDQAAARRASVPTDGQSSTQRSRIRAVQRSCTGSSPSRSRTHTHTHTCTYTLPSHSHPPTLDACSYLC